MTYECLAKKICVHPKETLMHPKETCIRPKETYTASHTSKSRTMIPKRDVCMSRKRDMRTPKRDVYIPARQPSKSRTMVLKRDVFMSHKSDMCTPKRDIYIPARQPGKSRTIKREIWNCLTSGLYPEDTCICPEETYAYSVTNNQVSYIKLLDLRYMGQEGVAFHMSDLYIPEWDTYTHCVTNNQVVCITLLDLRYVGQEGVAFHMSDLYIPEWDRVLCVAGDGTLSHTCMCIYIVCVCHLAYDYRPLLRHTCAKWLRVLQAATPVCCRCGCLQHTQPLGIRLSTTSATHRNILQHTAFHLSDLYIPKWGTYTHLVTTNQSSYIKLLDLRYEQWCPTEIYACFKKEICIHLKEMCMNPKETCICPKEAHNYSATNNQASCLKLLDLRSKVHATCQKRQIYLKIIQLF